jgi:hypothetical protein
MSKEPKTIGIILTIENCSNGEKDCIENNMKNKSKAQYWI